MYLMWYLILWKTKYWQNDVKALKASAAKIFLSYGMVSHCNIIRLSVAVAQSLQMEFYITSNLDKIS